MLCFRKFKCRYEIVCCTDRIFSYCNLIFIVNWGPNIKYWFCTFVDCLLSFLLKDGDESEVTVDDLPTKLTGLTEVCMFTYNIQIQFKGCFP